MSTMDLIKYHGGEPANFLDVGGGANKDQVLEGFRILLSSPRVKAVLVNIFGGIMKCDTIATALLAAYDELDFRVPLVVRLEGTNVELGKKLIKESGRKIVTADGLCGRGQEGGGGIQGGGVTDGGQSWSSPAIRDARRESSLTNGRSRGNGDNGPSEVAARIESLEDLMMLRKGLSPQVRPDR